MPRLVAAQDGNFTAPIWAVCDNASGLDAESSYTAVDTTPKDSSAFIPSGGVPIDAVLLKLAYRTSPGTSQLIVVLRNVTTGINVSTVTVNVSDLPVSDSTYFAGGWMQFMLPASVTPNGTDQYLIRLSLSMAGPSVTFYYGSTASNWARYLRTTTKRVPASGDQFIITEEKSGPGVAVARAVTMDNANTTQFGTTTGISSGDSVNAGLCIGQGGTLTWATGAGINYCFRTAGSCVIYGGGTMTMGVAGAEVPRTSTAILEFVTAGVVDSGLEVRRGGVFRAAGLSRTAGKDIVWTLLTANCAAGQPNATVLDDTGWLAGDRFGVASTTTTPTQGEVLTLASNAGATSLVATSNYLNAHGGTNEVVAEVGLLTRNVKVRAVGVAANQAAYVFSDGGSIFDARWVEFFNLGANTTQRQGLTSLARVAVGGSLELRSCSFYEGYYGVFVTANDSDFYTLDRNVFFKSAGTTTIAVSGSQSLVGKNWAITNNILLRTPGSGMDLSNLRGALNGNRVAGCGGMGIRAGVSGYPTPSNISAYNLKDFHSNHIHSCNPGLAQGALHTGGVFEGGTFGNPIQPFATIWRNTAGWTHGDTTDDFSFRAMTVYGLRAWGNTNGNIYPASSWLDVTLRNCELNGDSSFPVQYGFVGYTGTYSFLGIRWENCRFGMSSGLKTPHTVADIYGATAIHQRHAFVDCLSGSSLLFNQDAMSPLGNEWSEMRRNGVAGSHRTTLTKRGVRQRNTAVLHGTEPDSEQLTPSNAYAQLLSAPRRVAVRAGTGVTVAVWVLKDPAYGETTTPCLVLKSNPAIGIDDDVVLATLGALLVNVWTQLTGPTPTASDDGVMEFVIATQGTGGNVYVGQWTVS